MFFSPYLVLIPIGLAVIISIGVFGGGALLNNSTVKGPSPTGMAALQPNTYITQYNSGGGTKRRKRRHNKSRKL
jgi:hypothetical protein